MLTKKSLNPVATTAITLLIVAIVLVPFGGAHLNEIAARVFALMLYGVLAVSYIMRGALVFLGVFAVYQIIRERVNTKLVTP